MNFIMKTKKSSISDNQYDRHTLSKTLNQVEKMSKKPLQVFVNLGYRSHDYQGNINIHVDKVKRGTKAKSLWKWMKRRADIKPVICHLKQEHRMGMNWLKGTVGDTTNALLSATSIIFIKPLNLITAFLSNFYATILFVMKELLVNSCLLFSEK